ncbi:MAG TPA: cytochrome c-type biogenesis CcmF C-terminal domain-containing protein [Solirubrobacteraceae bacterium]|nr:cytochrome c-type biogenesis CcmF C-terminal domain-containing protein [Solirubrobacteraceae bacterium]
MGALVGRAALVLALCVCVYGIGASLYGARTGRREWVDSGRRSVYALAFIVTVAFGILELAFLRSDFSYDTVANTSSLTTPTFYKAAAVWSSQEGSLLLWLLLLSLWSSLAIFLTRKTLREVVPYATAVLLGFGAFFASMTVFLATPFATTHPAPTDGAGLDPLLRHPSMMIHPPMLYSGYTLFTIPFAFAVGALITRRIDAEWIRATRRFALASWLFLGIGILLGARWSYAELGWGGYWGWDPVENAALMPWLIATAFIHSIMIQEKRGMLKIWNASLVLASGTLAILGTFLVRSGILQSIHAFGASTLGTPFVVLIVVLVVGSLYLVISRREILRSENRLDSLLSREAVFMLNNLVLVGLCFVIFWGTFFPLISQALTGSKAAVGPPWFSQYTVPLALILVLLSGVGPVIAWRRATPANAKRNFRVPVLAALGTLVVLLGFTHTSSKPFAIGMFCAAAFVFGSVGQEFWRGIGARRAMSDESPPAALISLVRRNRRRYGGYTVHIGMAVLFVGVAASTAFQHVSDVSLRPGQSTLVGGYRYTYEKATSSVISDPNSTGAILTLGAVMDVTKHGHRVAILTPSAGYYPAPDTSQGPIGSLIGGETTAHIGLQAGLRRDIWTAVQPDIDPLQPLITQGNKLVPPAHPEYAFILLAAIAKHYVNSSPTASFHLMNSPLVTWIWFGGFIVFTGGLTAMWPTGGQRVRARYLARVGRDLQRA